MLWKVPLAVLAFFELQAKFELTLACRQISETFFVCSPDHLLLQFKKIPSLLLPVIVTQVRWWLSLRVAHAFIG